MSSLFAGGSQDDRMPDVSALQATRQKVVVIRKAQRSVYITGFESCYTLSCNRNAFLNHQRSPIDSTIVSTAQSSHFIFSVSMRFYAEWKVYTHNAVGRFVCKFYLRDWRISIKFNTGNLTLHFLNGFIFGPLPRVLREMQAEIYQFLKNCSSCIKFTP